MMKHLVFVYGTLKREHHNHHFLYGAKFIGEAVTYESDFRLEETVDRIPFVCSGSSRVRGEVYQGCDGMIKVLDTLEQEGTMYTRDKTVVVDTYTGEELVAWIYYGSSALQSLVSDYPICISGDDKKKIYSWIDINPFS